MNKIVIGLILGAVLGAIDGGTAWFTPEVRKDILGILAGSTFKGIIAGIAAGWFARKVQNVVAGIAFGLVVGALLAYGVVAMGGGKYFWEIMLPGSLVGAICGWATQQYGVVRRGGTASASVAMLLLLAGLSVRAEQPKALTGPEALAKLKSLAGTWKGDAWNGEQKIPGVTFVYRVSGGGSVVEETQFANTPHEMVTMYVVDGGTLHVTHYCGADNQPSMNLNLAKSTPTDLEFDFAGVTGQHAKDYPHIRLASIKVKDADSLETVWTTVMPDGKAGDKKTFVLTRTK
jgi:hypothetical protein